ncbi:MAG: hypothetical protein QOK11_2997 [Pseudonocardiales bacterium]|nr:hypothetical protein [Pseudonocardiales bacterium]
MCKGITRKQLERRFRAFTRKSAIRITWRQLANEPDAIASDLYSLLSPAERGS